MGFGYRVYNTLKQCDDESANTHPSYIIEVD